MAYHFIETTFFLKKFCKRQISPPKISTYFDPGTPHFPTIGVFMPELKFDLKSFGDICAITGLMAPESIGGFGGVEIGSGKILVWQYWIGIPQCTSASELFKLTILS
jgi:hypothetical protein